MFFYQVAIVKCYCLLDFVFCNIDGTSKTGRLGYWSTYCCSNINIFFTVPHFKTKEKLKKLCFTNMKMQQYPNSQKEVLPFFPNTPHIGLKQSCRQHNTVTDF